MKLHVLCGYVALAVATLVHGQTVREGAPTVLVTNSTLTNVWTAGAEIDLKSYDSIIVTLVTTTNQGGGMAQLKYQWSSDDSTWLDENVLLAGTASGTEQPYTFYSRVIQIPTTNSVNYVERLHRLGRYFRPSVSSTNVFTTGRITVTGQIMNNQN